MALIAGFIIEGTNSSFLSSGFHWRRYNNQADIFVHHVEEIGDILLLSQSWEIKPMHLYPAQYDHAGEQKTGGVKLLSEKPLSVDFL